MITIGKWNELKDRIKELGKAREEYEAIISCFGFEIANQREEIVQLTNRVKEDAETKRQLVDRVEELKTSLMSIEFYAGDALDGK